MPIVKPKISVSDIHDTIAISRFGKKVYVKGKDGSFQESDSVEANLLFEILQETKKKK